MDTASKKYMHMTSTVKSKRRRQYKGWQNSFSQECCCKFRSSGTWCWSEGITILRNIENHLHSDRGSHIRDFNLQHLGMNMPQGEYFVYLHILYDALETDWSFGDVRPFWVCINLANGTSHLGHPSEIQYVQIKRACCRDSFAKILCPIYLHLNESHITHNLAETSQE